VLSLLSFFALVLPQPVRAQYPGGGSGYPGGGGGYPGGAFYGPPIYSGGTTTVTTSPPSPTQTSTTPYGANASTNAPGAWGGGAFTYIQGGGGSGSVTCAGQITANFTWNPGPNNAPAPASSSVIVVETANAAWSGPGSTGSCGIANPTTPASQPPNETGTRYTTNGGGTISVNCTPTASMSGYSPQPYQVLGGSAYVGYVASVSPVTINLVGTTPDSSGNMNILVGQGCTASLVGIPSNLLPYTTYSWTIPGNKFQAWGPTPPANFVGPFNPNVSYYVAGPGPLTNPTAHWYWNEAAATETVKCTATVTPPPGMGASFSIMATKQVSVANPTYACTHSEGAVAVIDGGLTLKAYPTDNSGHGETWYCNVQTPVFFGSGGSCNFSQLITPGRSHTYSTGAVSCTENGKTGLDTLSPYPAEGGDPYTVGAGANAGWPADNSKHRTGDSPSTGLSDSKLGVCASVSINESFNTSLMYLPPGSDVQPVPLHEVDWQWAATISEPPGGWASANMTPVGPVTSTASARSYAHPQWIRVESPSVGSGW